jgi:hypothetical protein
VNHSDWESQRERLSAYLDGEVSPAERAELDAHMRDCEPCQRELAALRQTRALLRTLPTPALPRDFSLPEQPVVAARSRAAPAWARPAQAIGTIAAMIGLAFLIATALPNLPHGMAGSATSASGGSAAYNATLPGTAPAATTASPVTATPGGEQSADAATPHATASNTIYSSKKTPTSVTAGPDSTAPAAAGTYAPDHNASGAHSEPAAASTQPFPVAPVAGFTLLFGGAAAVAAGSLARRRSRDDEPDEPDELDESDDEQGS